MKSEMRTFWPAICAAFWLIGCGTDESAVPSASDAADSSTAAGQPAAPDVESLLESRDLDTLLAEADLDRGRMLYLQCRACHSLGEGEPHKVGPNLYGMFGREAGTAPGFSYSEAMVSSDIVWDPQSLDQWLARPSEFLPGNRMVFVGIRDPRDRANLIAFLQRETGAAE